MSIAPFRYKLATNRIFTRLVRPKAIEYGLSSFMANITDGEEGEKRDKARLYKLVVALAFNTNTNKND